jgi:indoleamine 2,3-dioxygenase
MWGKSKPGDYTSFRTFIFGITSQSMFPHGVIYEGVSEEPLSFRGESGANDSMVLHGLPSDAPSSLTRPIDPTLRQPPPN